jgi:Tfp pilus assembly protein PilX
MKHPSTNDSPGDRDEGAALIIALVMIVIAAMIVLPRLTYVMTVTQSGRVVHNKASRAEAVKGGLRTALADGKGLYKACAGSSLSSAVGLASPGMQVPVDTSCTTMTQTFAQAPADLWFAAATTWTGSLLPTGLSGTVYPYSGDIDKTKWTPGNTSATATGSKIFAPDLPIIPTDLRSNAGYGMPAGFGACRVFFPGKYTDPLNLTANSNYFFVSGVYYFENTVRFSGDAQVVIGDGVTTGCASDLDAVSYADYSGNFVHHQSGAGATFIFGGPARLVVDDATLSTTGNGVSVKFNKRLVGDTEADVLSTRNVSIMSVNGIANGPNIDPVNLPQLFVPAPLVSGAPASTTTFQPSILVPTVAPSPPTLPIVDFNVVGLKPVTLAVDSYVAVPQGAVQVSVLPTATAGKTVSMVGGVLAAQLNATAVRPASFTVGLVNQVVQRTFKIVAKTKSGTPSISATALVKVNDTGDYRVVSYVVQGA